MPPQPKSLPSLDELDLCESSVVEEYKIIQGKLDKIGEFRFHVKNWTFTLTLAVLAAGITTRTPWWSLLGPALIPTIAFWSLERRQDRHSRILGRRAKLLEAM